MGDYSKTSESLLIRDLKIWRFGDEGKACEGRPFHNRESIGTKVRSKWDVLDVLGSLQKDASRTRPAFVDWAQSQRYNRVKLVRT